MNVAVSQRHREHLAQTPSHRDESADVFVHDAATLSLRSSRSCYVLYVLTTTKALPRRLEFFGNENLGASVTLLLRSCRSGYVPTALMLRYRRLSCAHVDFVTLSPRFYRYLIIRSSSRPGSSAFLNWMSLFWILGLTLLRSSSNMSGSILM